MNLKDSVTAENVLEHLEFALDHGDESSVEYCWRFIDAHASRVFRSNAFLNLSGDRLCQILRRDSLNILELTVFQQVIFLIFLYK